MVRLSRVLSVAALASTATLAQAQQPAQTQPAQPGQVQPGQLGQAQPGRPGQAQPGQAHEAHPAAHAQGVSLNAFIAHKLKRGNEAEVELGQMAVDRADSDRVKEFAQMMVKSHQEMIKKLDQFDQGASEGRGRATRDASGAGTQSPDRQSPDRKADDSTKDRRNDGAVDGARSNTRNSESNTDGEGRQEQRPGSGGSQASSGTGTGPSNTTPNQAGQPVRGQVAGQPGQGQVQGQLGGMTGHVPHMLVALTDQSCDNELELTKKMLQKHEGDEFDMAYIGQQIVAHTCMLAHLQALKNSGPQELQQLATEGEQTTLKHLDHAVKIAKELGEDTKEKK